MTKLLHALTRRVPRPDPARETMRVFVRTLARLARDPRGAMTEGAR
ncbi:hypothetical protein [Salinarimonas ramus]|nr:hypothetical protein [Salinarimonas ramus]